MCLIISDACAVEETTIEFHFFLEEITPLTKGFSLLQMRKRSLDNDGSLFYFCWMIVVETV